MYVDLKRNATIYQGNNFYKGIIKKSGETWETTDSGYWEILDSRGTQVATGSLVKSDDNLTLIAKVTKNNTQNLAGKYRLLIVLTSTDDSGVDDVLADYTLNILKRAA